MIHELCDIYDIRYPDSIVGDSKYLVLVGNIDGRTELKYDGTCRIVLKEYGWLSTVFHEFYHYLDLGLNDNQFVMSVGENGKCDFSGTRFYLKYCNVLWKLKEVKEI